MDDLTVLLGASEADLVVVEDLKGISRHGLLRPFLVVRPDFQCVLIENGEVRNVGTLDQYTAGSQLARIRVIRLSLDGAAADPTHLEWLRALRSEFGQYIDHLEFGTLTVLPRDGLADPQAFVAELQFNLLVEPRDMAGEAGFAPTLMTRERQIAMATGAVAAIGGLWTWMEEAPFELFETGYDGMGARVSLMRLTTRVVDAGDLTARSVAWALSRGGQRPAPLGTTRHNDPQGYLRHVAAELSPVGAPSPIGLSFAPEPSYVAPQRVPMRPLAAIAYFCKSLLEELRRLPEEIIRQKIDELKQRLELAVQNSTFGADSAIEVELSEPSSFDQLQDVGGRLARLEKIPGLELGVLPSSPVTWDSLGTVVHGICDGTDFPDRLRSLEPEWDGKRAVISQLDLVASVDGQPFQVLQTDLSSIPGFADRPFDVRSYDVAAARALETKISDAARVPPPPSWPDPEVAVTDDVQSTTQAPPVDGPTDTVDAASILAETVEVDETISDDDDDQVPLRDRFAEWKATRADTLLWRIGERLVDDQIRAAGLFSSTAAQLQALITELEMESEQCEKRRKRFILRAVLLSLFFVTLIAVATLGFVLATTSTAVIIAVACLVGVALALLAALRMARTRVRDRHRINDLMTKDRYLGEVRRHAAGELHRLIGMYDQFLDWSEILGASIHEPWGGLDTISVTPWRTTTGALSFICGEPSITEDGEMQAALATAQRIAKRGWIHDAFLKRREDWISGYQSMTHDLNESGGDPESDNRQGASQLMSLAARGAAGERHVFSPRVQFRREYIAGDRSADFRQRFLHELRVESEGDTRQHIVDSVRCDTEGLSGRSVEEFTSPIVTWDRIPNFNEQLTPSGKVDHTILVHSVGGITDPTGLAISDSMKVLPVTVPGDRSLTASFRMDVTTPLQLDQTSLIAVAGREPEDLVPQETPTVANQYE